MNRSLRSVLIFVLLSAPVAAHSAPDLYVSDQLETTLRTGPGTSYKIVEMLTSGASVARFEEAEGWTKVRTAGGKEGWVLTRHLTSEPPKGPQLAATRKELDGLRAQHEQLRGELASANAEKNRLSEEAKRVRARLEAVDQELTAWKSANRDVLALGERAAALEREQTAARAEVDELRIENRALRAREKFYWFFSGVVVLLLGWGLGYVYASSRFRAKSQSRFRY